MCKFAQICTRPQSPKFNFSNENHLLEKTTCVNLRKFAQICVNLCKFAKICFARFEAGATSTCVWARILRQLTPWVGSGSEPPGQTHRAGGTSGGHLSGRGWGGTGVVGGVGGDGRLVVGWRWGVNGGRRTEPSHPSPHLPTPGETGGNQEGLGPLPPPPPPLTPTSPGETGGNQEGPA